MPDSFDIYMKQKSDERKENQRKQAGISKGRPFILGSNQATWKYHDCFMAEEQKKDYVMPYFVDGDPYEATEEELLRAKILH